MKEEDSIIDRLFLKVALHDDEEAFRTLFHQLFTSLCLFAYRYITDWETCQDIVQDAFFKMWKNRKSIEIISSTRNYLITNVRNGCIDLLRKKEVESVWRTKEEISLTEQHSDSYYTLKELQGLLTTGLTKLPPPVRRAFEMNRFEGKTYPEIAKEMEVSIKTVEAYMTKALKQLRKEFKDYLT